MSGRKKANFIVGLSHDASPHSPSPGEDFSQQAGVHLGGVSSGLTTKDEHRFDVLGEFCFGKFDQEFVRDEELEEKGGIEACVGFAFPLHEERNKVLLFLLFSLVSLNATIGHRLSCLLWEDSDPWSRKKKKKIFKNSFGEPFGKAPLTHFSAGSKQRHLQRMRLPP